MEIVTYPSPIDIMPNLYFQVQAFYELDPEECCAMNFVFDSFHELVRERADCIAANLLVMMPDESDWNQLIEYSTQGYSDQSIDRIKSAIERVVQLQSAHCLRLIISDRRVLSLCDVLYSSRVVS